MRSGKRCEWDLPSTNQILYVRTVSSASQQTVLSISSTASIKITHLQLVSTDVYSYFWDVLTNKHVFVYYCKINKVNNAVFLIVKEKLRVDILIVTTINKITCLFIKNKKSVDTNHCR